MKEKTDADIASGEYSWEREFFYITIESKKKLLNNEEGHCLH